MKHSWALMMATAMLSCGSASPSVVSAYDDHRSIEEHIALRDAAALAVVEELAKHRFERVQARMSDAERRATSPNDLASFWADLEAQCGALVGAEVNTAGDRTDEFDFGLEKDPWISPTSIACQFERGVIKATISVEQDGTISILRIHAPPAPAEKTACRGALQAPNLQSPVSK
jgi:hypothetical protein